MSGASELLQRWRLAETTIGTPGLARDLPPRLQELLDALEALDQGDEAGLNHLADRASPDVAALLRLLLAPADQARPDWSAVPETFELPFQDLLALLDVARTGAPGVPTARLDIASRYRPVLHALVRLCTDARTDVYSNPVLAAFSRRVDQLQMVTRATQVTGSVARTRLGLRADALVLRPERWPEITAERVQGDLDFWATTRIPWDEWHDEAATKALSDPPDLRRRLLGQLLDRLGRDLRAGRVTGSARPVRAAFSLAWSLEPEGPLVVQLALLQLRTDRYDPEHPGSSPLLLLHLWRHRHHLRREEQVRVALALLEDGLDEAPADDVRTAALRAIAHTPDPDQACELLLRHAVGLAPDPLLRGLLTEETPIPRRVQIAGLHAAAHRVWDPALAATRRLAQEAADCVPSLLRTVAAVAVHQPPPLPALQTTWDTLLERGLPLGVWGPVLSSEVLRASLRPDHLLRLRQLPGAAAADHAARALLAATPEEQRAAVLELGRHLRNTPTGDDVAIEVLGWWLTWNPVSTLPQQGGRPVAAWLLRQGGGAVRSLQISRSAPWAAGAVAWWLSVADPSLDTPAWRERLADLLVAPAGLREATRAAAREVALHPDLGSTAQAVQAALRARHGG